MQNRKGYWKIKMARISGNIINLAGDLNWAVLESPLSLEFPPNRGF
jgi:hypothetical protein